MVTLRLCLLLALAVAAATAETVSFQECPAAERCTMKNLQVFPCPEAEKNQPCKLRRGTTANMVIDFEPDFPEPINEKNLKSRAYWVSSIADLPFIGMNTNACLYMPCPLKQNQVNVYNYTLDLSKNFPAQMYDVKWRIWEDQAEEKKECCLIFKMRLV